MPPKKKNPAAKKAKISPKTVNTGNQIKEILEKWCVDIETNSTHHGEKPLVRVPKYLQTNYEATKNFFVPQEVSLGPVHFLGKEDYHSAEIDKSNAVRLLMEGLCSKKVFDPLSKFKLFKESLDNKFVVPSDSPLSKSYEQTEFIVKVKDEIKKWNESLARSMGDDFITFIMFRDTCFLLVCLQEWEKEKKLPNFGFEDIVKMENQIPFSLLESLHEDLNHSFRCTDLKSSCRNFASDLLSYPLVEEKSSIYSVPTFNNLLDCMHQLVLGKVGDSPSGTNGRSEPEPPATATEVRLPVDTESSCVQLPSATKLRNAGIHIKSLSRGEGIRQIVFKESTSTLYIPKVFFGDFADVIWRNLIAYEIKQKEKEERGVIRFVHLMKDLVGHSRDTDLLIKSEVFGNRREEERVTKFWSKLGGKTTRNPFTPIEDASTAVRKVYQKKKMTKWRKKCYSRYCSTPWSCISATAATCLLLFTAAQVVCLFCKCNRYGQS